MCTTQKLKQRILDENTSTCRKQANQAQVKLTFKVACKRHRLLAPGLHVLFPDTTAQEWGCAGLGAEEVFGKACKACEP